MTRRGVVLLFALTVGALVAVAAVPARAATSSTYNVWMSVRPLTTAEAAAIVTPGTDACDATEVPGFDAVSGEPDGEFWTLTVADVGGCTTDEKWFGLDYDVPECEDYTKISRMTFLATMGNGTDNPPAHDDLAFTLFQGASNLGAYSLQLGDGAGTTTVDVAENDIGPTAEFLAEGPIHLVGAFTQDTVVEVTDALGIELEGDLSTCDLGADPSTTTLPTATTTVSATTTTSIAQLPRTGSRSSGPLAAVAIMLVLSGAAIAAIARRRNTC